MINYYLILISFPLVWEPTKKKFKTVLKRLYDLKLYMGHVMRKPVFGISDQVWLNPACSATEAR